MRQLKIDSFLHILINDLDFSSIYPTLLRIINISKRTMRTAIFKISNMEFSDIEDLYSNLVHQKENAMYVCSRFFNLPTYTQMSDRFERHQEEKNDTY